MARLFSAEVKGVDKLRKRLVDIIPAKTKAAVSEAMLKGAGQVVAQAKALAPKDSGALAASVHHTEVRTSKTGALYVSIVAGIVEHHRTGSFNRGRLVEFGTVGRPAEPFFFSSFRSKKAGIRRSITAAVKRSVREN